jgi:uncharacterized protein YgiM (DUF1202 family)
MAVSGSGRSGAPHRWAPDYRLDTSCYTPGVAPGATSLTKGGESALYRHTTRVPATQSPHAAPQRFLRAARLGLVLAPLLFAFTVSPARADSVATVLSTDGLRLRSGPGTEYRVVDTIPGGTRIAITGQPSGEGWYPAVHRGQRGWVLGSYLAFDDATAAAARRATVTPADGLNLRSAPMESAEILAVLPGGAVVTATGRATADGWVLVLAAEQSGWVNAAYLTFEAAPAVSSPVLSSSSVSPASLVGAPAGATRVTVRYYSADFEGSRMACGGVFRSDDVTVAATNSWPCGTVLRVCNGAPCITVTVRDRGGMATNEIDLSVAGFTRIAPLGAGQITATAEVIGQ